MNISKLIPDPANLPGVADNERAQHGRERWREEATRADRRVAEIARWMETDPAGSRLLDALFGNSPFLGRCAIQELPFLCDASVAGPQAAFDVVIAGLRERGPTTDNVVEIGRMLRKARRRVALLTAVADITGAWTLEQVMAYLSAFADEAIGQAVAFHLRDAAKGGSIALADPDDPQRHSGVAIIAMGKLGAHELNYSSDIDLIALYDDEIVVTDDAPGLQKTMVRLTRNLMRTLDEQTKDGYVFRTDLRLRPDPASTPLAVAMRAAEVYYESAGQNWERAAMIKARPIAGDLAAGRAFIEYLTPFVWRKNLDFAAIEDIHSIKRQIHAHRGGGRIAARGHNIKLGRGGIREIEFFAQTQQLIWGGRDSGVRLPGTCEALHALAAAGYILPSTATELEACYHLLRRVEHRLQMIEDRQTQSLPEDEIGFSHVATFLGYPDAGVFEKALTEAMRTVERHYAQLFEEAPTLSGPGNLVFTGSDDDPDTLATLESLGYSDARSVASVVRGWHHGRYRATRNTRARELLTELMPTLLDAFAKTANPSAALMKFDEFLARLPAGVQLFSMFHSNPRLVGLLAEIMGSAPRLADHLSRNAGLFDAVLSPDFFDRLPPRAELANELQSNLLSARSFEDVLDHTRQWTKDVKFRTGVQLLRHTTTAREVGRALSDVAETNIEALQPYVEADFAESHGRFPGGGLAVVAMGRLGSREMTHTSDLDLIFVYDSGGDAEVSDGPKPLAPSHYFARLCQRFLNSLTAPTAEGTLYEVDMRLRPSGNQGPIATSLDTFRAYQAESAWTWEHMALTRARAVSGPAALRTAVNDVIKATLTRQRDAAKLVADVADMRLRIAREHPGGGIWDMKYVRGGLVDIEFIAQYLQLLHAATHPAILATNTVDALTNLGTEGLIDKPVADTLVEAALLWQQIQGLLRVTIDLGFDPAAAPVGLKDALAAAGGAVDFASLEGKLQETADRVHGHFGSIIDAPAAGLSSERNEERIA
jgi:glutamate-ammonia-ligase adenylyltransferase